MDGLLDAALTGNGEGCFNTGAWRAGRPGAPVAIGTWWKPQGHNTQRPG
jgi:hypothetical protein